MQLVIDTHVWLYWITRDPNFPKLVDHLNALGEGAIGLSSNSAWEVALKLSRGGDTGIVPGISPERWISHALSPSSLVVVDLTIEIAVRSVDLPSPVPHDPADRFITATAQSLNKPLLTFDRRLLSYDGIEHYVIPE